MRFLKSTFFFICVLTASKVVFADPATVFIEQARKLQLSEKREWKVLLHYRRGLFGAEKSDIDGPDFFLSPMGRTDPEAELEATIKSFFDPIPESTDTQHPQCRYPARYAWLNENLHFGSAMPTVACERYQSWREKIDPGSITLVFSGYYLNNPASMYGHTFLRVGRSSSTGVDRPLLDYTINFAARTNTKNGLVFAMRGLLGGYPGTFSALPYYMKVQQYNNLESRDLWEYKLDLPPAAVDRLVAHLWEMGPTSISYYFFNRNCSYQLLPMLEVADPSLHLSESFRFRAIPVDTLRAVLESPLLVSEYKCRPSAMRQMIASRSALTKQERELARLWAVSPNVTAAQRLEKLSVDRQRRVLESAYDYFRYRVGFARGQPLEVQQREQVILLALNRVPSSTSTAVEVPVPTPPHLAHKTGRVGLSVGANRHNGFEEISVRGALHDLETDPAGFVEGSQLEMMSARLRFENGRHRFYVENFTGVHIESLAPWEEWVRKPSWRFQIQYARAHDLNEHPEGSGFAGVNGGSGVSLRLPWPHQALVYSMIEADSGVGGVFDEHYRLGLGASAGVFGALTPWWRAHFKASYIRYGLGDLSSANRLSLIQTVPFHKDFELRLTLNRENHYQEGMLSLNRYF